MSSIGHGLSIAATAALFTIGCAPGVIGEVPKLDHGLVDESGRLPTGTYSTTDVRILDLDRDGHLDIVWTSQNFGEHDEVTDTWELPGGVDVSLGDGSGRFVAGELPPEIGGWTFVEPADVDGDGDQDLLLTGPKRQAPQLALLINDGHANFTMGEVPALTGEDVGLTYSRVAVADLDEDGDVDVLLSIFLDVTLTEERPNVILLNDGSGTFTRDEEGRLPEMPPDSDYTLSIAPADFNGDGACDLIVGETERQSRLLLNDGRGFFTDATGSLSEGGTRVPADMLRAYHMLPIDMDNDGDRDLVVINDATYAEDGETPRAFGNYVLPNDGAGGFGLIPLPEPVARQDTRGLAVDDLNGDGIRDIVIGNAVGGAVQHGGAAIEVFLGDGAEGYAPVRNLPRWEKGVFGVAVGDLNEDGWPDIAAAVGIGDETASATSGDYTNILLLSQ